MPAVPDSNDTIPESVKSYKNSILCLYINYNVKKIDYDNEYTLYIRKNFPYNSVEGSTPSHYEVTFTHKLSNRDITVVVA